MLKSYGVSLKKSKKKSFSGLGEKLSIGAFAYAASSVAVKAIGALYKIPLNAALGAEGAGLYQMVFPLYALLLTLSGAALPQALTRAVSGGYSARGAVFISLSIFGAAGAFFSIILAVFGEKIAAFQGNADAGSLYAAISPAVFICSVIAVFRGAVQGCGEFLPTAVSQLIEQIVKAVLGLFLVYYVGGTAKNKATLAAFAVTFSEVAAVFYLANEYRKRFCSQSDFSRLKKPLLGCVSCVESGGKELGVKRLLFYVAPLCASGLITPLAGFLDGVIALNLLKPNFKNAVSLYGAFAGGAQTVLSLPVGALTAFASAYLPRLVKNRKLGKGLFAFIACCSALAAALVFCFSDIISETLFKSFGEYLNLIAYLLRLCAPNIVFESLLGLSNVILLSREKHYFSVFSMLSGLALKIALDFSLIKIREINVCGLVISDCAFYLLALALNLGYIIYISKRLRK